MVRGLGSNIYDHGAHCQTVKSYFVSHELPLQLVSGNGLQFTSHMFEVFRKQNRIKHISCTLYHASTNGLAERFVHTFKTSSEKDKVSLHLD